MATGITPVQDSALDEELERIANHKGYLLIIFLLVSTPGLFNTWHTSNYVFFASAPAFYCKNDALSRTTWTHEQKKDILMPPIPPESAARGSCEYYDLDYESLSQGTYEAAKQSVDAMADKKIKECSTVEFLDTTTNITSVVEEWSMVCKKDIYKTMTLNSVILGKLLGALIFGPFADKFGRLLAIQCSFILYFIFGLLNYWAFDLWLFCFCRLILGIAGTGTFNTGITLLLEICDKKYASLLGVIYNIPYSFGMVTMAGIAYGCKTWRDVILYMNVPMAILVIPLLLLPESPRWCIQRGLAHRAWRFVRSANCMMRCACCTPVPETTANRIKDAPKTRAPKIRGPERPVKERVLNKLRGFTAVCTKSELIQRLLISWFLWPAASFTYYVLNISADNLGVSVHEFIALSAIPEAISYIFPIPLVQYFGRKLTLSGFYISTGVTIFLLCFIPREMTIVMMAISLIARLGVSAAFGVVILYTSELFPTEYRSTALGTSATLCHLAGLVSTIIVEKLGAIAFYLPTFVCAVILVTAGFLTLLLPETKGRKIPDTYEDIMENGEFVSYKNVFKCQVNPKP